MIGLDYPASPLLMADDRSAGVRLPNPFLHSPNGTAVRLYDLLPNRPVLIGVSENRVFEHDLPLQDMIRIGTGGYSDAAGLLREMLGGKDGWILVRPDAHVAWARHRLDPADHALQQALGKA